MAGIDPRVLAIVGPCSVHDPTALLDFARRFKAACEPLGDAVFPVLRVHFEKDPERRAVMMSDLCGQIQQGQTAIRGIMLESHLVGGSQPIGDEAVYVQSVTGACLSLEDTVPLLQQLAAAVRVR